MCVCVCREDSKVCVCVCREEGVGVCREEGVGVCMCVGRRG